jgi:hypothetical protein
VFILNLALKNIFYFRFFGIIFLFLNQANKRNINLLIGILILNTNFQYQNAMIGNRKNKSNLIYFI